MFHKPGDFDAFARALGDAGREVSVRLLAYCLMPNHFHLVAWPVDDGDLSRWMHWLTTAHVRRYHEHYHTTGHIWQGRFKAFPVQEDDHLLAVIRYVERNPLRAGLCSRSADWPWSSTRWRGRSNGPVPLGECPVALPDDWPAHVDEPRTDGEWEAVRESIRRNRPFGSAGWTRATADRLGLSASLRPRGRPRKAAE